MGFEEVMLACRIFFLFGTGAICASWKPGENTTFRPLISLSAALFTGSCLGGGMWLCTTWPDSAGSGQFFHALYSGIIFVWVACARGNVAKMLPRLKWRF